LKANSSKRSSRYAIRSEVPCANSEKQEGGMQTMKMTAAQEPAEQHIRTQNHKID
jgi:hypothetical protein